MMPNILKQFGLTRATRLYFMQPLSICSTSSKTFWSRCANPVKTVVVPSRNLCIRGRMSSYSSWKPKGPSSARYFHASSFAFSPIATLENHVPFSLNISDDKTKLKTIWNDDTSTEFNSTWLRYQCHCEQCKQPGSSQRLIGAHSLPPCLTIESANISNKDIFIKWIEDEHRGQIPVDFLYENKDLGNKNEEVSQNATPDPLTSVPEIHYEHLIAGGEAAVLEFVQNINKAGMCLVKRCPTEPRMVAKVAEIMAPVQNLIYGVVWDVVNTPKPINVAYSTADLCLHVDLNYYQSPPGIQLLHCLRNDECVTGGLSTFRDMFHAAEQLRQAYPHHFATLCRVPATFQKIHYKRERPVHMVYTRHHIVLNEFGHIIAVNWSPPFEGPLQVPDDDINPYYEAYWEFSQIVENEQFIMKYRAEPGDVAAFNNCRLLHGRTEVELNGGQRHLQGCYVNIDEYKSRLIYLLHSCNKQEELKNVKRVGNYDLYK